MIASTAVLAGCLDGGGPAQPDGGTDDGTDETDNKTDGGDDVKDLSDVDESAGTPTQGLPPVQTTVRVKQDPGKATYWVPPGPRELSPQVFGNEAQPRATGQWQKDAAPPPVRDLLGKMPFLVGAPADARKTKPDGSQVLTLPTPFPDKGRIVEGRLDVTYEDRVPYDVGKPHDTGDSAKLVANFTDPAGNRYVIHLKQMLQPPIPGYETGSGVFTSAWHHGTTLTGTPLMPKVFTYGAFYGQADLYVNGKLAEEDHVVHFMTTQATRNSTYDLVHDEDLPLKPSETIAGQVHHTHGFFTPIEVTKQGPQYDPVDTNFTLPNGKTQPFIHIMYEQDEIVEGPFKDWTYPDDLPTQVDDVTRPPVQTEVKVKQGPGNATYWVPPGPRELSPQVFGSEDNPRTTGQWQRQAAPPPVKDLIGKMPFLVGAPSEARKTRPDGTQVFAQPTPFGDKGRIVNGSLEVTYQDRAPYDIGKPHDAVDTAQLKSSFTSPGGNHTYRVEIDKRLLQPPVPGYETGSGVLTGAWHHGTTLTGTPLMPKVFTYGAFYAQGDLYRDGELVEEDHVVHYMTTQQVRNTTYGLVHDEDLPLRPSETISGQVHHTHGFFTPIEVTKKGPQYDPVNTSYELPNGKTQPFIHIMYEQDEIVKGPFKDWTFGASGDGGSDDGSTADVDRVVHVNGTEYSYTPTNVSVQKGQTVKVVFTNTGSIAHNWGVPEFDVRTETIQAGETDSVTFTADKSGTFTFYCSVGGHREAGMEGHVHSEG